MHPGDDPQLAARFLDWLRLHGALRDTTRQDMVRLTELGAWTKPSADVITPEIAEAERLRLLDLHVAWRHFSDDAAADWIGKPPSDDGDVVWVDANAPPDRMPPPGAAPRLLPLHSRQPHAPARGALRPVRRALVVPLLLAAAGCGLYFAETTSEARLAGAIAEAGRRLDARPAETGERVVAEAGVASTLRRLRTEQRALVNARCESGTWCDARVEARDRSLRLADQLAASAASWRDAARSPPTEGAAASTPPAFHLSADLERLERERDLLATGRSSQPSEPATAAEIARRLALVEAEIALVHGATP